MNARAMPDPPRLALACAALFGVVAVALFAIPTAEPKHGRIDAVLAPVPDFEAARDANAPDAAAAILLRPLFTAGRLPAVGEGREDIALGGYRLAGTISNARVQKALFRAAEEAAELRRGVWVAIGEDIGGWRLVSVAAGSAVMTRGSEQVVLSISKRKALTPKQRSQLRAATPIRATEVPQASKPEIDARVEKLNEALSKLDDQGFYGAPN